MKQLILSLLILAGCETKADKQFNEAIRLGHEAVDIASRIKDQRDSLSSILSAYQLADSLNRANYDHGNGTGWYQVNPWMKEGAK